MKMCKYHRGDFWNTKGGGIPIADPVMRPVIAILIGALLIAVGILFASSLAAGVGLVLGIAGVATVLVGIAMLFGIAHEKK